MGFFDSIGGFFENAANEVGDFVSDPIGGIKDVGQYAFDTVRGQGLFDDLGAVGSVLFPFQSGYDLAGDIGVPALPNYGSLSGGLGGSLSPYAAVPYLLSSALPAAAGATGGADPSTGIDLIGGDVLPNIFGQGALNASGVSSGAAADAITKAGGAQNSFLSQLLPLATIAGSAGLQAYGNAQLAQAQQDFLTADREDQQQAAIDLTNLKANIENQQLAAQLKTQINAAQANAALAKQRLVQQAFSELINNSLAGGTGTANALGNLATLGQRALG